MSETKECVDHYEVNGIVIVRGILCDGCNLMIGHGRDNPEILRSGANYLEAQGHA